MHFAAKNGIDYLDICKKLNRNGLKVDVRDKDDETPLFYTLREGDYKLAR